jgi:hypothetical protein
MAYVGQNMADSWSSANNPDKNVKSSVQRWYDEVYNWPSANIGSFTSSGANGTVGHYTQVIWAETQSVGCGAIYYKDGNAPSYPFRKVLYYD